MVVVVDRPPGADVDAGAAPETQPARQRVWGRLPFPWHATAVGGPVADDEILIINATDEAWVFTHGYKDLGTMPPHDQQVVTLVRRGVLSARPAGAPAGAASLTLALTPAIHAVELSCTVLQDTPLYTLAAVERRDPSRAAHITPPHA